MSGSRLSAIAGAALAFQLCAAPLLAQGLPPAKTLSGYQETASLETGDSVTEDLALDDQRVRGVLSFPGLEQAVAPWFAWKKRLNDEYGLKLQFSYQSSRQTLSDTLGEEDAAAMRLQLQGSWDLLGRGTKNKGTLTFRLEERQRLGTAIPPTKLAFEYGGIKPSGGFSDFGFALTELAWRQSLMEGRLRFVVGKISALSWYNGHALSSSLRGFQNLALQSSLTKPAPGRGIGGGVAYEFSEHFGVVAGIHDANAKTADNPFDTIDQGEFYKSVEFRYWPTNRDMRRWDVVRLQFWQQDALKDKGVPESKGVTFLASRLLQDRWFPFVIAGLSDGKSTVMKKDFTAGLGVGIDTQHRAARDIFGIAVNWGEPSNDLLREQVTTEAFYALTLVQNVVITPSVQWVRNPAASTAFDDVFTFGLRFRTTF
ncbi:carbohydrate porin [Pseudoruegeria sp. SHC-113]|uniref:carbohydrate porin n=1 Tax=Pseudoruegeria sp. SHC-113 TaxID=2855439 RepID=UPI0021BB4165|nr:carbohydrate porin [Pseudoruegeria sp. SHC-113]MCT8159644.1 carbohydrate porin [Pseudoruegeria sp. SHC-113]